ncbi:MAG: diacylglycerol/lipid kinase family protein [Butyrivibrio sp.]
MKERMLFVFNPYSGKSQIKNKLLDIINIFTRADYEITIYPTQRALDAYDRVCAADGKYDCIVCSGGDGTLNEVIAAVSRHRLSRPRIGYIPSGSTNDFAATLGISKNMIKAAYSIATGTQFPCDIGKFNDRYFNYVAAFGVFTEVSYTTPQNVKNVLGHQAYVLESLKSISKITSYYMEVKDGDHTIAGNFIYGMISNSESVGGLKGICGSGVSLNDGLFEVALVREPKDAVDLQLIVAGLFSKKEENPMIERFKADHLVIESDVSVGWTLDGENGDSHQRVEINVIPKAVDIIIPQKTVSLKNKLLLGK